LVGRHTKAILADRAWECKLPLSPQILQEFKDLLTYRTEEDVMLTQEELDLFAPYFLKGEESEAVAQARLVRLDNGESQLTAHEREVVATLLMACQFASAWLALRIDCPLSGDPASRRSLIAKRILDKHPGPDGFYIFFTEAAKSRLTGDIVS
jgi:hypothetical protein